MEAWRRKKTKKTAAEDARLATWQQPMTKDHCRRTSRSQDASDLLQLVRIHSWLEEEKQKKEEEEEEGEAEEGRRRRGRSVQDAFSQIYNEIFYPVSW